MHPDLHRYLDGEIEHDELPADLAAEAAEWDRLLSAVTEFREVRAPAWLEDQVMAALPTRGRWQRVWDWIFSPRAIQVRPLYPILVTAALAILALLPMSRSPEPDPVIPIVAQQAIETDTDGLVYVQFVFVSPNARSVSLAGDFNGWDPDRYALTDYDGDGVWTGFFALPAGQHKYMFVVDGQEWVTDPRAERYLDDGFGMRNAVISVAATPARSS